MALSSRFAAPVSDATEDKLWLTRIPKKMQKVTAWGMRVWDDWAAARPVSSDTDHDHYKMFKSRNYNNASQKRLAKFA